jgi:hypothetical protein
MSISTPLPAAGIGSRARDELLSVALSAAHRHPVGWKQKPGMCPMRPTSKKEIPATVVGYWAGSTKALLRLVDGRTIEALAPLELEDHFTVGDEAIVYFDDEETVIGWYLIAINAGVNLRHSEAS